MTAEPSYLDFVRAKAVKAPVLGLPPASIGAVNPILHRHQPVLVKWLVEGGRRALFANFGLGKTMIQLEVMRLVAEASAEAGTWPVCLIIIPLTVVTEFKRDAATLGTDVYFVRTTQEISSAIARGFRGIFLTNYESVREGKIDTSILTAVSLDEASCLRGFGGTKTFREFMAVLAGDDRRGSASGGRGQSADRGGTSVKTGGIRYRFVATATPSPNEYIELLAYAAFLGVMDVGQAKTRFFRRNSEKADQLTLHPHKEAEFWLWVNSWAAFIQRPSDLGFSDEAYELPPIDVRWHEVPSDHSRAGADKLGQGRLLKADAIGVVDASREKRETIDSRVAKMVEIVRGEQGQAILRGESREGASPRSFSLSCEAGHGDLRGTGGAQSQGAGLPEDVLPPGTHGGREAEAAPEAAGSLCGGRGTSRAGQESGYGQASSQPQCEAQSAPSSRVRADPGGLRDAVDDAGRGLCDLPAEPDAYSGGGQARALSDGGSLSPDGACPRHSVPQLQCRPGSFHGQSGSAGEGDPVSRQQWVVWCDLNDEQRAAEKAFASLGLTVASIEGATPIDERVRVLEEWRACRRDVILSKPVVLGSGMNLQQCNRAIYLGIGFKFNDWVQSLHRIQRFLQTRPVTIDIIFTEAERSVRAALEGKWKRHDEMCARMSEIIREYGLGLGGAEAALQRSTDDGSAARIERGPATADGQASWEIALDDTVLHTPKLQESSVGLVVTSIPFGTQYEYTPKYNDFGHTDDNGHFFRQMDWLTPAIARALMPGRMLCVHVKDRVRPGGMEGVGFQTVDPFHAECIAHYRAHGLFYMGMITVETDVVRENNQTYRLGYTEQCKDGSRMSVGMPEYVLLFRKAPSSSENGYADVPVVKDKAEYSLARWQIDAHTKWRSGGDRLLTAADLIGQAAKHVYREWRGFNHVTAYDHEHHVALTEALGAARQLPTGFTLLPAHAWHEDVWSDVARMRTLNGELSAKGREMHLCPLQFDIVDRLIRRFSNKGDLVYDPFGGVMTVPLRAVMLGRRGAAAELNQDYFEDGLRILREADQGRATPSLFDLIAAETPAAAEPEEDDGVNDLEVAA